MVFWEEHFSDETMGTFFPIVVYWIYAGVYHLLPSLKKFRLHTLEEKKQNNVVELPEVIRGVLVQQTFQVIVAQLLFFVSNF